MGKIKKSITITCILLIGFSFIACNISKDTDVSKDTVSITIELGEYYPITDEAMEQIDVSNFYVSEDDAIADIIGGKYIVGHDVGCTTVTAYTGDAVTIYNVEVTECEEYRRITDEVAYKEIKDISAYLGSGYNAFKASGYISSSDLIMTRTIISLETIENMLMSKSLTVYEDKIRDDKFINIQGSNAKNYEENYYSQINGNLGMNLGSLVACDISGKYTSAKGSSEKNEAVFTSILSYNRRIRYMLSTTKDGFTQMAKDNGVGWKRLTGEDGTTAEELFDIYGTHVLISVDLGGRMEFEYLLKANSSEIKSEELIQISGKINTSICGFKAEGTGSYDKSAIELQKNSNTSVKTFVHTYGGNALKAMRIGSLGSFYAGYSDWYGSINESNYDFIGTTSYGLLPIWYLLDEEHKERADYLCLEYNRLLESKKNNQK